MISTRPATVYTCNRCENEWCSRKPLAPPVMVPRVCPACMSPHWNDASTKAHNPVSAAASAAERLGPVVFLDPHIVAVQLQGPCRLVVPEGEIVAAGGDTLTIVNGNANLMQLADVVRNAFVAQAAHARSKAIEPS